MFMRLPRGRQRAGDPAIFETRRTGAELSVGRRRLTATYRTKLSKGALEARSAISVHGRK